MYLCPLFENLQVSQAWTEYQAGSQPEPQLQLKWSLQTKWEHISKNDDGSQYTAAYHEETTALFKKALKWAWCTFDGIEMIEEEPQVPSKVAEESAQAEGEARAPATPGVSAQRDDEAPGCRRQDQGVLVDRGTQDIGELAGSKRARQDVEDGEGREAVNKVPRVEAGRGGESFGTDKVLESGQGDPIVIEEDIGEPKDMDGVVSTTHERRCFLEYQQLAHIAKRRVGV